MTEELTEEQKEAENERLAELEAKQEKNRRRGRPKKAVAKKAEAKPDTIECVTLKKIHRPDTAYDMTEVGETVYLSRENARLLQEANAVRVVI